MYGSLPHTCTNTNTHTCAHVDILHTQVTSEEKYNSPTHTEIHTYKHTPEMISHSENKKLTNYRWSHILKRINKLKSTCCYIQNKKVLLLESDVPY